ncbi:MAG TPA: alkaline phosphatase family protein [Thermoanaerobaculia bacterium]|nr:alkaline phosphatase family protein [Thermoanaerobaculia bacterium]
MFRGVLAGVLLAACAVRVHAAGVSDVHRVVIVILENEDESRAVRTPFLSQLAARGALLRNFHGITHPSQPNYIALVAGNTYHVHGDSNVTVRAEHLGDLLEAKNLEWKVYAEDYPGACFLGRRSGKYVRKHVPFLSFADVSSNEARCAAHVVDASHFDADAAHGSLPQFAMYIPNLDNDGHDTSVATADAWLRRRFGALLDDPRFIDGTLFVVTFDEGRNFGPNVIYCALYGAGVQPGAVSDLRYDHYSLLRTVEEIFHLGTLHQRDATSTAIDDIWRR